MEEEPYIVKAQCTKRLPLPGLSSGKEDTAEGAIVDCVVCCLSLMGSDWLGMIKEARRVMKMGYVFCFSTLPMARDSLIPLLALQRQAQNRRSDIKIHRRERLRSVDQRYRIQAFIKGKFQHRTRVIPFSTPIAC